MPPTPSRAAVLAAALLGIAASPALSAGAPASASAGVREDAYPGGVGRVDRGPGPAGRSSFRTGRSAFKGTAGGWGFARDGGWHGERSDQRRRFDHDGDAYPLDGFDGGYAEGFGPPPIGPEGFGLPPYAVSPDMGRRYPPLPPAFLLAPSAFGPGPHDGAYSYGYPGYAQTPAMDVIPAAYTTRTTAYVCAPGSAC